MISVCMTTYNGERFIKQQLQSILMQLGEHDEVIAVDDGSTDETLAVIEALGDARVRVNVNRNNLGPMRSFELGLAQAKGEIIFLADQDDVWWTDKVSKMQKALDQGAWLAIHDAVVTDGELHELDGSWNHFNHNQFGRRVMSTVIKNPYTGAMMAFRRALLPKILPFPAKAPMHDWWIGAVCLKEHLPIATLPDQLMDYRRHGGNVTGNGHHIGEMIRSRLGMVDALCHYQSGAKPEGGLHD